MAGTRKGDIVMMVTQNNRDRTLTIDSVDGREDLLQKVLGYAVEEIAGRPLNDFLPPRINEILADYLEFRDDGKDLGEVLQKTRNFAMMAKNGAAVEMDMRIQQGVYTTAPRFMMVMQDKHYSGDACRKALIAFKEGAMLEPVTLLLDEKAFFQGTAALSGYIQEGTVKATLALIRIDGFDDIVGAYGVDTGNGLLREMVLRCREVFRESDLQAYLGKGRFAVALIDADQATSRVPLNRLRLRMANQPLFVPGNKDVAATLTVISRQMRIEESITDSVISCDRLLTEQKGKSNQILET